MKYTIILLLLITVKSQLCAQALPADMQMEVDVAYLASDLLGGRASGSRFEQQTCDYITARMQLLGLEPAFANASYQQRFELNIPGHGTDDEAPVLEGINVAAYLDRASQSTIVIGAHHDHLGFGGSRSGSLSTGKPEPHNGADDNASGVAVMLDLARRFQLDENFTDYNLLFIAFGGEELGLIGSKYFLAHIPTEMAPMAAMINFDMVGRLNAENVLAINGSGTSPSWEPLLQRVAANRVELKLHPSGLGPSDHASFYLQNIPVLHFFTGQHEQYHKPTDDVVLVNFAGMRTISDIVFDLIVSLGVQAPAFAKTKDESAQQVSAFKVTMGIMPDYVFTGTGMRIDGILADRPAERAGLLQGDVVLKLGDLPTKDIYGYMDALSQFEPGQTIEILIDRKGKKLRKKLTF